jgi:hypothetical protein
MKNLEGKRVGNDLDFSLQADCSFVYIRAYKGDVVDDSLSKNVEIFSHSKYFFGFYSELTSDSELASLVSSLCSLYQNTKVDLLPACLSLTELKEIDTKNNLTLIWKFIYEWQKLSPGRNLIFRLTLHQMKTLKSISLEDVSEEYIRALVKFIEESSLWIIQEGDLQIEELKILPAIHEFGKAYGNLRFYGNQKQLETWMKEGELPVILSSGLSDGEKIQFVNIFIKILQEGQKK